MGRKLSNTDAADIRRRHRAGENQSALATEFGVTKQTVSNLCRGNTYRDAGGPTIVDMTCEDCGKTIWWLRDVGRETEHGPICSECADPAEG